ncbi:hypothetical protein JCM11251_000693 [Rhodosporidiobolus azoricus]
MSAYVPPAKCKRRHIFHNPLGRGSLIGRDEEDGKTTTSAPIAYPTSARDASGDLTFNIYGYNPSLAPAIVYIICFALITAYQTYQVGRSRIWWLSVLLVGGIGEIVGWIGRLLAWDNPYDLNWFLMQIICLILAPCFFSATIYGILGMIVRSIGREYSLLRPSFYLILFCTMDLIAIVVQAVGGGMAAIALKNDDSSSNGTHIMVAGVAIQLFAMICFCILGLDVWRRARKDRSYQNRPHPQQGRLRAIAFGLTFSSIWLLIRCIYRVIELAEGWTGYLMTHEPYFCVLDAMCMVFAQGVFMFTWPNNEKTFYRNSGATDADSETTRAEPGTGEKVQRV